MAFRTETENKERFITESSTHFQITLRVLSHSYRFEGEQQWEHRKVSSPVNFDYGGVNLFIGDDGTIKLLRNTRMKLMPTGPNSRRIRVNKRGRVVRQ